LLDFDADPFDGGLHATQLLDLRLNLTGPHIGVREPRLRLSVILSEPGHLLGRCAHLLQAIGEKLTSPAQSRELFYGLLHARPDFIDSPHACGQIAGDTIKTLNILAQRRVPVRFFGDRGELT
jgi:hypothetical protein